MKLLKLALESRNEIKGYKKNDTSEDTIKEYKKQYPNLSHVKTGKDFDGILLDDDGVFVAVLQCNVKTGYIVALEVSEDYRGQKIAQVLLRAAQRNFNCYKLTVNKKNNAAISLYEKTGYKVIKEEGVMLHMEKEA